MIFTEEFIMHFDICNDRIRYKHDRPNEEFYQLKNSFLKIHATQVGYDLQYYRKGTIKDFQIDEVFTVTDLDFDEYWNKRRGISDFRWCSTHWHILERYRVYYHNNKGKQVFKIYHIPTNEWQFKTNKFIKQSESFELLKDLCQNKVGLKSFKTKRKPPFPSDSLKWLKEYFEVNKISLQRPQMEMEFAQN